MLFRSIETIAKKIIADVKGVLTFEDKPKLDYKVNQAPWSRKEVPSREGLNDWKVDLINSIHAVAPQGIDEVNTPKSTKRVRSKYPQFNVQQSQSLNNLGPNVSGPYMLRVFDNSTTQDSKAGDGSRSGEGQGSDLSTQGSFIRREWIAQELSMN